MVKLSGPGFLGFHPDKRKNPLHENLIKENLNTVSPALPIFSITWRRTVPLLSSPFIKDTGPKTTAPFSKLIPHYTVLGSEAITHRY